MAVYIHTYWSYVLKTVELRYMHTSACTSMYGCIQPWRRITCSNQMTIVYTVYLGMLIVIWFEQVIRRHGCIHPYILVHALGDSVSMEKRGSPSGCFCTDMVRIKSCFSIRILCIRSELKNTILYVPCLYKSNRLDCLFSPLKHYLLTMHTSACTSMYGCIQPWRHITCSNKMTINIYGVYVLVHALVCMYRSSTVFNT
jgi:hypothetical protein